MEIYTVQDGIKKSPFRARLLAVSRTGRAGPGAKFLNVFAAPPPAREATKKRFQEIPASQVAGVSPRDFLLGSLSISCPGL